MTAAADRAPVRSFGAILFDLVILGLAALLVVNSLGLRPGVGLVPLIVGVPTLIATLVILVADLFPALRRVPAAASGRESHDGQLVLRHAAEEEEEEIGLATDPASRRRQAAFAAWVIGFAALLALTSVYIATPVALAGILFAIRLPWWQVLLIVTGTVIGFYGLFHFFLGLRL